MPPTIHIALVDDWELRGDGSGDMEKIQIEPLRRLLEVYDGFGLKASINAEVMQQLAHRRHAKDNAKLGLLADRWDESLLDAVRRGHDVQLHAHPQWGDSAFDGSRWDLRGDWDITHYPRDKAFEIVSSSRDYLEKLLRRVDPGYRVRTFRSGSWAIAPSDHMMEILVANGVVADVSIVGGMRIANRRLSVDYSVVEEPTFPFYPDLRDARRVSDRKEPIVCIPTFSFHVSVPFYVWAGALQVLTGALARVGVDWTHLTRKPSSIPLERRAASYEVWRGPRQHFARRALKKLRRENRFYIADLSEMSGVLWRKMLAEIRRKVSASTDSAVPIVLENHTKDLGDMRNIRLLAEHLARQDDVQVLTLREIASNLEAGRYSVRKR